MPSPFDPSNFDPAEFRRQSFNNALAEMGRSLVQAGSSSPTPVGFAQGLGMGMGGFNQGMQAGQGQAIQRYLLSLEIAKKKREEEEAARKAQAAQRRQQMISGMSPEDQQAIELGGGEALFGARYRAPPKSLEQIEAEARASNAWRPTPPGPKSLEQIEAEARATAQGRAAGTPAGPPKTRTIPRPNGMEQVQNWIKGQGWRNEGEPVPRWRPQRDPLDPVIADPGLPPWIVNRKEGTARRVTVPNEQPPPTSKAVTAAANETIRQQLDTIDEVATSLDLLAKNPQATGVMGYVVENLGGLLGQVTSGDSDLGAAENQTLRTNLQAVLGRMIPQITNDTSGRYTEGDMQRVRAAVQATNPMASAGQIKSALTEILDISKRSIARASGTLRPDIPEASVMTLLENPRMRDEFDKKYGPGAARTVLGR